jgi:uncharacterized membrane protein YphA (DoxX/SURF4 family)
VAAIPPIQYGMMGLFSATLPTPGLVVLQLAAGGAAALLLVGSWTPVAGVLMAVAELGLALSHPADPHPDPWMHIRLGALGAALAMLGPGALSVDARRFGRKRIQIPQR